MSPIRSGDWEFAQPPALPAIVIGDVTHRRRGPVVHGFRYRICQWLIDLDDPFPVDGPLRVFADIRAADHIGDIRHGGTAEIKSNIVAFLFRAGIDMGPMPRIIMLANARTFGYAFDPLTVFWCWDTGGELRCVVAEVHNTYHQRSAYILYPDPAGRASADKTFYVSPFNRIDGHYDMRFVLRSNRVAVAITLHRDGMPPFTATFDGRLRIDRQESLYGMIFRTTLTSQRVRFLITVHGILLWMKGLPVMSRPESACVNASSQLAATLAATAPGVVRRPPPNLDPRWHVARLLVESAVRRVGVRVRYPDGTRVDGVDSVTEADKDVPEIDIVNPRQLYARMARHPKIGLGEAYMSGDWCAAPGTDLADALTPFAERLTELIANRWWRLRGIVDRRIPRRQRNSLSGARRNIEAHYDLSNVIFESFLDPTLSYSSAVFADDRPFSEQNLYEAQLRKIDAVLDLANVREGSRILEIGSGWGALAIRAAERGAYVTTITLSVEQHDLALRRIAEAGLDEMIDIRLQDYREVSGEFDAVVSVEMIEAVGEEFWPVYFGKIDEVLSPDGIAVIQAITMSHDRMLATRRSFGWIQKYIFPGGLIPSLEAIDATVAAHTSLRRTGRHDYGRHYAETLRRWRRTFAQEWPRLHERLVADGLGDVFDDRFRRMWEYYLAYSEAGFASGYLQVSQLSFMRRSLRGRAS